HAAAEEVNLPPPVRLHERGEGQPQRSKPRAQDFKVNNNRTIPFEAGVNAVVAYMQRAIERRMTKRCLMAAISRSGGTIRDEGGALPTASAGKQQQAVYDLCTCSLA